MDKLEAIPADDLRKALAEARSHKAVRRLMIALAYKNGDSVATLSCLYGLPESTVYYWLDRFEKRGLTEALEDESRPGRPRKLDEGERASLVADLGASPVEYGYDADDWTPELVCEHIDREYGVEYSMGHIRRLLREEL